MQSLISSVSVGDIRGLERHTFYDRQAEAISEGARHVIISAPTGRISLISPAIQGEPEQPLSDPYTL